MIGAHLGNWEIGGQFFGNYAKKMNIVMYDAEYQNIKEKLKDIIKENFYHIIPVNEDTWSHVFAIKEALDKKEYVCFQGDRFVNEKHILKSSFLGKEANFPAGPFQIASRFKVPVVFYFSEKENHYRYSFRFFLANPVKRNKGITPEQALLSQYIEVLENRIKEHPEQWFNFYPFWKESNKKN
jgi:predicted LPLAT superfamily acyltransferase